jgi:transcriptional regulator with XRE-family HTH domain
MIAEESGQEPLPSASDIRRQLQAKGISVHAIAARLKVNRAHLHRVLNGERAGSRALLESVAESAQAMASRRPQEDSARLIDAAVHVFFVKRGNFQSEIFNGAAHRRANENKRRRPNP